LFSELYLRVKFLSKMSRLWRICRAWHIDNDFFFRCGGLKHPNPVHGFGGSIALGTLITTSLLGGGIFKHPNPEQGFGGSVALGTSITTSFLGSGVFKHPNPVHGFGGSITLGTLITTSLLGGGVFKHPNPVHGFGGFVALGTSILPPACSHSTCRLSFQPFEVQDSTHTFPFIAFMM